MKAKEQLIPIAGIAVAIAIIAFIAGMYYAAIAKPCLQIFSECITSEKATALAKQTPHYQEFLQAYPQSTPSYEGDYSSGQVTLSYDSEQPVLRIGFLSSGNIEYTTSSFECSSAEGTLNVQRVITTKIIDDKMITEAIKNKGCKNNK